MTGAEFGTFILWLVVAAIVVAIGVWLLNWLYLRSSKERAFVRTGLGGQKVVMNGGAFVLPIVHEVIPVNMNTLRLEVARGRDKALITRDRMRVDVVAEFYVRVQAVEEAIAAAARTLGTRTMQPEQLKELVEGKFVDSLRSVAAEMTMEDLHEKRGTYVRQVRQAVADDLLQNGLELETVSLTQLDQTSMEFFNPSNAFDAEGLTRLTEQIERRKKIRNDIEQDTMIQIRNKNLETEKQALDLDRELEYARLNQERDLEIQRAAQRAEVARERADREQEAERAQIASRESIERARIVSERSLEEERIAKEREVQHLEIERRKALEMAEQLRAIAVAGQSKAQSEAQAAADRARAEAVVEEERVFTARETEMAERRKKIEMITATQEAERDGIRLKLAAQAERDAAGDRGAAMRAEAEADADSDRIRAVAARIRHEVEAEGARLMNEAANTLTPEARMSTMRLRLIDKLDAIIREQVKPMERIEGIKILHVDGLGYGGNGSHRSELHGGFGGDGSGGFADSVVNSALRYRAQAPLVDQLLREIGMQGGDVGSVAQGLLAGSGAAAGRSGPAALSGPGGGTTAASGSGLPAVGGAGAGAPAGGGPSGSGGGSGGGAGGLVAVAVVVPVALVELSAGDQGLHVDGDRRFRRCRLGRDPRLQRPAGLDTVRRRVADRGQQAIGPDRLYPPVPAAGRRRHSRAVAGTVRLRLPVRLRDPREPDGRRELRRDAEAHAGDRRRAHVRRVVGRVRPAAGPRAGAGRADRPRRIPDRVRCAQAALRAGLVCCLTGTGH